MSNLKDFLKMLEGSEQTVYDDTTGNPTIGAGINLNVPGSKDELEQQGQSYERVLSGDPVDQAVLDNLMMKRISDAQNTFQGIKKNSFPNAQFLPHEETALGSMVYNNPNLLGPNMRKYLSEGNKKEAIREIMLKSNRNKDPGILKRRIEEAKMFKQGDPFEDISESELLDLQGIVSQLENSNVKQEFYNKYPKLMPTNRYLNLKRDINK